MILEKIASVLGAPIPFLLIFAGIFFSFKLKFFWVRHPIKTFSPMLRRSEKEGVSPFRALTLALAGTLGVGNIAGVAGAIALGGFGAIFWMWVSALCAMVLKYAEITLAVFHRREDRGSFFGGAPYYIRDYFGKLGLGKIGAFVASVFAVVCIFEVLSTGCGIQINAAASALESTVHIPAWTVGAVAAGITLYSVLGGANGVSHITVKLIPALSLGYISISLAVIFAKFGELPRVFGLIFSNAFGLDSAAGGVVGFLSSRAIKYGAMRGLLSNEAGCGTSPLAHASAQTNEPAEQGFFGIFEVFFDTIVICTMTATVIILSYDKISGIAQNPIELALLAYSHVLGEWARYFLGFSVAAFGIATVLCCAYYGNECIRFLFGKKSKLFSAAYILVYIFAVFFGSFVRSELLWNASDITLSLMTITNVICLCLMSREVKILTDKYFKKEKTIDINRQR